jgi:hypothetical protein
MVLEEMERTDVLLRRSWERIRISLELLDHDVPGLVRRTVPTCKSCDIQMAWSRSTLGATHRQIINVFTCSQCGEIAETKTRANCAQSRRYCESNCPAPPARKT